MILIIIYKSAKSITIIKHHHIDLNKTLVRQLTGGRGTEKKMLKLIVPLRG